MLLLTEGVTPLLLNHSRRVGFPTTLCTLSRGRSLSLCRERWCQQLNVPGIFFLVYISWTVYTKTNYPFPAAPVARPWRAGSIPSDSNFTSNEDSSESDPRSDEVLLWLHSVGPGAQYLDPPKRHCGLLFLLKDIVDGQYPVIPSLRQGICARLDQLWHLALVCKHTSSTPKTLHKRLKCDALPRDPLGTQLVGSVQGCRHWRPQMKDVDSITTSL